MKNNMTTENQSEITTLEDMQAIQEARLEYCEEMGISIEDASE